MGGLRGRSGQVFGVTGLAEQPGATLGAMVKACCVVGFPGVGRGRSQAKRSEGE
jgi:hypothetical protein